jgi:hypothetical protein
MADTQNPLHYHGSSNHYVDVAVRGGDEHLGLNVEYAVHPHGFGAFIVRFVVHGKGVDPKNYVHLTYRQSAKFIIPATKTTGAELFKGIRLNKVAIKAFEPAVQRFELDHFATKFGMWDTLTEWIADQITAEGFTFNPAITDFKETVKSLMVPKATPEDSVKSIIEFPDLNSPEQKAAALHLVQAPDEDETDEDDSDEDDDTIN